MTGPPSKDVQRPPWTSRAAADFVQGELLGPFDLAVRGVNAIDEATADEITFIDDAAHAARWAASSARVAIVSRAAHALLAAEPNRAIIVVPDAQLALIRLLRAFEPAPSEPPVGVHPSAVIDASAAIEPEARIGPHVSVGPESRIGAGAVLHAGVRLGAQVTVGSRSVLHSNTVVRDRCRIGSRVILHQNVSIGADGFGYRPSTDALILEKIPHVGIVIVEDDVEIGAGTCVDRAKFAATVIQCGTKIDNLCQIGHNCRIGKSCVIAGLTALAGSVTVGDGASIAGQVAIAEHVRIGRGARIGGGSGVMRDVPDGETHLGYPADAMAQTLRQWAAIRKLPSLRHHPAGRG